LILFFPARAYWHGALPAPPASPVPVASNNKRLKINNIQRRTHLLYSYDYLNVRNFVPASTPQQQFIALSLIPTKARSGHYDRRERLLIELPYPFYWEDSSTRPSAAAHATILSQMRPARCESSARNGCPIEVLTDCFAPKKLNPKTLSRKVL
jgi:hypothetical protein